MTGIWPAWMHTADEEREIPQYVTGKRMRRINQAARELNAQEPEKPHPGAYKPVELEAHEDFAMKLAAREKKGGAT